MRKVLGELKDESGSVLMSIKYNYDEADSISNVALKQHVRYVLCTGQPRSLPLGDSATLHLSPIGRW
jgi:hypothetical protein